MSPERRRRHPFPTRVKFMKGAILSLLGWGRGGFQVCSKISLLFFRSLTRFSCPTHPSRRAEGRTVKAWPFRPASPARTPRRSRAQGTAHLPGRPHSPRHTGGEAVHSPEAVHRTTSGPTRADPSSQLKRQLGWRAAAPAAWGQVMLPRSGALRGGHWVARNNQSSGVSTWETWGLSAAVRTLPK